jgi:hypothetical protein
LVFVDQLTNVARVIAGLGSGDSHRAAEADVIADDIDAGGILQEIVHVCLANPESSVDVSAVVSFATFGHAAALLSR